jgi:Phage integrase, N-terminal SAM-like domain
MALAEAADLTLQLRRDDLFRPHRFSSSSTFLAFLMASTSARAAACCRRSCLELLDQEARPLAPAELGRRRHIGGIGGHQTRDRRGVLEGGDAAADGRGLVRLLKAPDLILHAGCLLGATSGGTPEPPEADAERRLTELLREYDTTGLVPDREATVETFSAQWLEHVAHRIKPVTHKRYRELLAVHVVPVIGQVRMTEVRPAAVQAVVSKVLKVRSPRTAVNAYRVLSEMLGEAVRGA